MVVRGKATGSRSIVQELGDGPGERYSVVGAGAAADLVENDQASRWHCSNVRRLGHLHHEGALERAQFVAGPTRVKIRSTSRYGLFCSTSSHLGHERNQGRLPNVNAFARHVWAGNEHDLALVGSKDKVVGNEGSRRQNLIENRMAALAHVHNRVVDEFRPAIRPRRRQLGQSGQHVQRGQHLASLQQTLRLGRGLLAQAQEDLKFAILDFLFSAKNLFFYSFNSGVM